MNVFDLLDRETARFARDFRACALHADTARRHAAGEALLRRVAAYLLALEAVVYPPLVAAELAAKPAVLQAHERLRRCLAETLLSYCGTEARAFRLLCRLQRDLRGYVDLMRREVYPMLYQSLSAGESQLMADDLLQWLAAHRRHHASAASEVQAVVAATPVAAPLSDRCARRGPDLDRLPTLHHVVPESAMTWRSQGGAR